MGLLRFLVLTLVSIVWGPAPGGLGSAAAQLAAEAEVQEEAFPASLLQPPEVPRFERAEVLVPADPRLTDRLRVVYWPGDEPRARRALELLEGSPSLPGLPEGIPSRGVVFLAPDADIWNALTGGRIPEWGAGVAIPSRGRIVIPLFEAAWGGPTGRDRTIVHEWAHIGLHEWLDGLRIPRWFDEGYAQWASGGWDRQEAWRLRLALAGGSAPPLDSLTLAWPWDRLDAEMAYLLSASAVGYLMETSGDRGMEVFLSRWREAGDFEAAFRSTFGMTTGVFESLWARHVRETYGWVLVASRTAAFWLLAGVLLLVLLRIRRRRDAERIAGLRASEPPDRPAYWDDALASAESSAGVVDRASDPG